MTSDIFTTAMKLATKVTELKDPIKKYIESVKIMSTSTAHEYGFRLENFRQFIITEFDLTIDKLILELEKKVLDVYDVLSRYVKYLYSTSNGYSLVPSTIKSRVNTAKGFLESESEIEISEKKFTHKVKIPKNIIKKKEALSKTDVAEIINSCSDIRLRTYVLLLAATGMRATEALSTRICDYSLDSNPPTVEVRGEFTKTKRDRKILLTRELVLQIKLWIEYKGAIYLLCTYFHICNKFLVINN